MAGNAKPCPFCGSVDVKVKPLWKGEYRFASCLQCRASGPVVRAEEDAVRAWNERHGEETLWSLR